MLESIYTNNTRIGVGILALIIFFGNALFPQTIVDIKEYLIPLFIIVTLIEIYLIHSKMDRLNEQKIKIRLFTSSSGFDSYLKSRLITAQDLKTVNLSEGGITSDGTPEKREYITIIDDFLKSGKKFQRIFADTKSDLIYTQTLSDFKKHKDNKYFVYLLEFVEFKSGKLQSIMLIDNEEVCLGGGYFTTARTNTISIRQEEIVNYFVDYFEVLRENSIPLRKNAKLNQSKIKSKIEEKSTVPNKMQNGK